MLSVEEEPADPEHVKLHNDPSKRLSAKPTSPEYTIPPRTSALLITPKAQVGSRLAQVRRNKMELMNPSSPIRAESWDLANHNIINTDTTNVADANTTATTAAITTAITTATTTATTTAITTAITTNVDDHNHDNDKSNNSKKVVGSQKPLVNGALLKKGKVGQKRSEAGSSNAIALEDNMSNQQRNVNSSQSKLERDMDSKSTTLLHKGEAGEKADSPVSISTKASSPKAETALSKESNGSHNPPMGLKPIFLVNQQDELKKVFAKRFGGTGAKSNANDNLADASPTMDKSKPPPLPSRPPPPPPPVASKSDGSEMETKKHEEAVELANR